MEITLEIFIIGNIKHYNRIIIIIHKFGFYI